MLQLIDLKMVTECHKLLNHYIVIVHLRTFINNTIISNPFYRNTKLSVTEEETKQNDIDASQNVQIDNALNQLIDDTAAAAGNNNVAQRNRGGKNNKRHHKNGGGGGAGRSHTKAQQNNGKHLNGAHSQDESKSAVVATAKEVPTTNHHANTFHEFTVTEAAADHTPTD